MDRSATLAGADVPATSGTADRRLRLAGRSLRACGVVTAVGLVFLVAMFAAFAAGARSTGMTAGWINDVTGVLSSLLVLPGVVAVSALLGPVRRWWNLALMILGLAAFGAIVVLQLLLLTDVLTFEQQVGPVSVAYLALGVWLVVSGYLGSRRGTMPHGTRWGLFAAAYVGFPFWAFRTASFIDRPPIGRP